MKPDLEHKILSIAHDLRHIPNSVNRHFSFVVWRGRIVSLGWNDSFKTHPMGKKLGFCLESIHSELHAYIRLRDKSLIGQSSLINVRVSKTGKINISRPCEICLPWVKALGFRHVYYTNDKGNFVKEW